MKPHEETWRTNPLDGREVECPSPDLPDDDAYRIAEVYMGTEEGTQARFDRARLIAAAPDMARALLASGYEGQNGALREWHTCTCWAEHRRPHNTPDGCSDDCREARAALTKAGVL